MNNQRQKFRAEGRGADHYNNANTVINRQDSGVGWVVRRATTVTADSTAGLSSKEIDPVGHCHSNDCKVVVVAIRHGGITESG